MNAVDVWSQILTERMAKEPWLESLLRWTNQSDVSVVPTPLWQDSWHYLIFNQLGGSGVDSASLFR